MHKLKALPEIHLIIALILYTLLSLIFTYPLIFHLTTNFLGFPGDPYESIWNFWWVKYALTNLHVSPTYCPMVAYPFGTYEICNDFVVLFTSVPFSLLWNEVAAYNILILESFILAGLGGYYLCLLITSNKWASFVGGCIFAFCPYHFAHTLHHVTLSQIQWFPFCLAFLFKLKYDKSYKNAILFSLFFCLQVFSDPYYAMIVVLMVCVFFLVEVYSNIYLKNYNINTRAVKAGLLSFFLIVAASIIAYNYLIRPATSHSGVVPSRDFYELVIYSLRPWDFFVPMIYHPFFGKYTIDFLTTHMHGSNPVEQTLYLGYVPLILAIMTIAKWKSLEKAFDNKGIERFAIRVSVAIIVASLLFMLPAVISIRGHEIPFSLSFFLFKFTQIFRVMDRFDVLIMLSVSILASIGLKYATKKKLIVLLVLGLILFEYTPVPAMDPTRLAIATRPGQIFNYSAETYDGYTTVFDVPEVYRWLAEQKDDVVIAEYPFIITPSENETVHYRYLAYQSIHEKKMVNGVKSPEAIEFAKSIVRLNDSTCKTLKDMGVRYIIVHEDEAQKQNGLTAIKILGNIKAYQV